MHNNRTMKFANNIRKRHQIKLENDYALQEERVIEKLKGYRREMGCKFWRIFFLSVVKASEPG